jgi:thioredoxin reductase
MKRIAVLALLAMLACTTTTQQPAPKSGLKNLQVFPKDIPREELIARMKGFTRALGVRCNHCHVVTATEPKEEFDFASDAKDEKRNARTMILMARAINKTWVPRVAKDASVGCWTCHRGKPEPESPPPPPAQPQRPNPSR